MSLLSHAEHIADVQREHGARGYIGPFEYPQRPISKPVANVSDESVIVIQYTPGSLARGFTWRNRIAVRNFITKLQSDPEHVSPALLSEAAGWTLAHFKEVGKRSPDALARLAMALAKGHEPTLAEILRD